MYDAIVVGNDVSSLIAAVASVRAGLKTALLSDRDIADVYAESGYTFNIDPFPLSGFASAQTCERLFAKLDIPSSLLATIRIQDPGLQIILPEHRIELFHDINVLLREMGREFPEEAGDIANFYSSVLTIGDLVNQLIEDNPFLYPRSFNEYWQFVKKIPFLTREKLTNVWSFRRACRNKAFRRVMETQLAILSNLSRERAGSLFSAYIFSQPLRGLFYQVGGKTALMDGLRATFQSSGGTTVENCSVLRIISGKKISVDVRTDGNVSTLRGENLIVSTKWENLRMLLLNDGKFQRLTRRLKHVNPVYYPFTLHMGVFDKGLPEKMAAFVAVVRDYDRSVMDNNLVFLETSAPDDNERAPAGKRAISATVFLKESPLKLNNHNLEETSMVILNHLDIFLPFYMENLDYINIEKSIELSRKNQGIINQKFVFRGTHFPGMKILSNRTPVSNIFITGGMLMAGLGFEGEIISGANAAALITGREVTVHES